MCIRDRTRDRIYAEVTWLDKEFTMIDTGGIEPDSKDIILSQMREQAQIAIDTADVIIFITDVRQGLVDADSKVADMLRPVSYTHLDVYKRQCDYHNRSWTASDVGGAVL